MPLPHQLANPPQAPPRASCDFEHRNESVVTCGISTSFEVLSPAPGQVTYVLLSRSPLTSVLADFGPSDLHVLCTPPAFVLSQDQTLRQKKRPSSRTITFASSSIWKNRRVRADRSCHSSTVKDRAPTSHAELATGVMRTAIVATPP